MAQRYVLNSLNLSNLNNMGKAGDSVIMKPGGASTPRKDLSSSMHSLSKTRSPTRLSSKQGRDPNRIVPVQKYQELVAHYNELAKANKLLRMEKDQFFNGYHELKFIAEREKTQLCQAFEELKGSYIQMQNRYQALAQENPNRKISSSIQKLSSELEDAPPNIYTLKEQNNALFNQNRNIKSHAENLQRELTTARASLDKCLKEKLDVVGRLEAIENEIKQKALEAKGRTEQVLRRQLHQESQQRFHLGLHSQKHLNPERTKVSILLEQNMNLILWKQNLQNYYLEEIAKLEQSVKSLTDANSKQHTQIAQKTQLVGQLQAHLEAITTENQRIQQKSRIVEQQAEKLRAESVQVKQRASQEYKDKIAQILDKAFNIAN